MTALMAGLLWYVPAFAALSILGLYLFDAEKKIRFGDISQNLWDSRAYLIVMALIILLVKLENTIQDVAVLSKDYTHIIYGIEGNAHIVWIQNSVQSSLFIHAVSVFYVLFFMWLMVFTAIFFIAISRKDLLRLYIYGLLLNYFVLVFFYLFFNVTVTSMYPPETAVQPLLYRNDMYRSIVLLVGGFDDCFPSGHISVSTMITLILLFRSGFRGFGYAALATTAFTGFVILFLGIHWALDIAGGVLLGTFAYIGAQWPPISRRMDRLMIWLEKHIHGSAPQ